MEFKRGDRVRIKETEYTKAYHIAGLLGTILNIPSSITMCFDIKMENNRIERLYYESPKEFELIGKLAYHYVI